MCFSTPEEFVNLSLGARFLFIYLGMLNNFGSVCVVPPPLVDYKQQSRKRLEKLTEEINP